MGRAKETQPSVPDAAHSFSDQLAAALRRDGDVSGSSTRGLPLAAVVSFPPASANHYVVSPIDTWGRIADRSPLQILQWQPGRTVAMTLVHGTVVVFPRNDGREAITGQGHLRLPAPVRHVLRLQAGDRLLLLACREGGFLVAYPTSTLDGMVLAHHIDRPSEGTP